MTYSINAVARRVVLSGSAGTGAYSFSFEVISNTDIEVYLDSTKLTLSTDYTVTINSNGTGSVNLNTGTTNVPNAPTSSNTITIIGSRAIARTTDFVTAGDLKASSLNEQLDSLTIFDQQISERVDRSIKGHITDSTTLDMGLPSVANRKGTVLGFHETTGAPQAGPTIANVNSLASITSNINTVAGISSNVTTVAGISSNVTTVAGISGNVTTVAGISSNVTTVAGDTSNIGTVATNISSVNTNATNISAIQGASANATTATTKASEAAASQTAAASSASSASTSAATATTKAAEASTSAGNASTSASNSASSATAAASSATAAAASHRLLRRLVLRLRQTAYRPILMTHTSVHSLVILEMAQGHQPIMTVNALVAGSLYFNSRCKMRCGCTTGANWIAASPVLVQCHR